MGDVIYCKRCRGRTPGRPKGIEDFAIAVGGGPCVRKKMTLNVFRQIFLGEFRTVPRIPLTQNPICKIRRNPKWKNVYY